MYLSKKQSRKVEREIDLIRDRKKLLIRLKKKRIEANKKKNRRNTLLILWDILKIKGA